MHCREAEMQLHWQHRCQLHMIDWGTCSVAGNGMCPQPARQASLDSQAHWAAMSPYAKLSADDTDQICHPTEKEGCNRPELPLSPVGWLDLLISVYVCTLHCAFAHCSYLLASPLGMQHVLEAVGPAAVIFAFLAVHLCLRNLSHPCASLA